ncbi:MAG: nitrite reductase, partial [Magnetococcales bacterium]|nr:nitrite reductase [Magnetococcales bacterium]
MNALWIRQSRHVKRIALILGVGTAIGVVRWFYPGLLESYIGVTNAPLTYANSVELSPREFDSLADALTREYRQQRAMAQTTGESVPFARRLKVNLLMKTNSFAKAAPYPHIQYFRKAGILQYKGPETCLTCHATLKVTDEHGQIREVDTMRDLVDSVHFKFQSSAAGMSTYGFDGRQVNSAGNRTIPVGKIDRACGVPGSFTWTGWAELIKTKPEHANGAVELRSEGCGQCHIGGGYHPATEKMLPL